MQIEVGVVHFFWASEGGGEGGEGGREEIIIYL